jgi:hypothetical protein
MARDGSPYFSTFRLVSYPVTFRAVSEEAMLQALRETEARAPNSVNPYNERRRRVSWRHTCSASLRRLPRPRRGPGSNVPLDSDPRTAVVAAELTIRLLRADELRCSRTTNWAQPDARGIPRRKHGERRTSGSHLAVPPTRGARCAFPRSGPSRHAETRRSQAVSHYRREAA